MTGAVKRRLWPEGLRRAELRTELAKYRDQVVCDLLRDCRCHFYPAIAHEQQSLACPAVPLHAKSVGPITITEPNAVLFVFNNGLHLSVFTIEPILLFKLEQEGLRFLFALEPMGLAGLAGD